MVIPSDHLPYERSRPDGSHLDVMRADARALFARLAGVWMTLGRAQMEAVVTIMVLSSNLNPMRKWEDMKQTPDSLAEKANSGQVIWGIQRFSDVVQQQGVYPKLM